MRKVYKILKTISVIYIIKIYFIHSILPILDITIKIDLRSHLSMKKRWLSLNLWRREKGKGERAFIKYQEMSYGFSPPCYQA